jgi:hypothetical protein
MDKFKKLADELGLFLLECDGGLSLHSLKRRCELATGSERGRVSVSEVFDLPRVHSTDEFEAKVALFAGQDPAILGFPGMEAVYEYLTQFPNELGGRYCYGHTQTAGDRHMKTKRRGVWLIVERTWDPNSSLEDSSTDREVEIAKLRDEKDADTLLRTLSGIDEEKYDEGVWY